MSQTQDTQPQKPDNVLHLKLVTMPERVQQDCVEFLESYLELARTGRITSVAMIALKADDTATYGYSLVSNKLTLLGAVDCLKALIRDDLRPGMSDGDGEPELPDAE